MPRGRRALPACWRVCARRFLFLLPWCLAVPSLRASLTRPKYQRFTKKFGRPDCVSKRRGICTGKWRSSSPRALSCRTHRDSRAGHLGGLARGVGPEDTDVAQAGPRASSGVTNVSTC